MQHCKNLNREGSLELFHTNILEYTRVNFGSIQKKIGKVQESIDFRAKRLS